MVVFYWVAGVMLALMAVPAALYFIAYIITGEDGCQRRALILYRYAVMIALFSFNFVLWKHVILGFWALI